MTQSSDIRDSLPGDLAAIEALYDQAFPDEDLLPLVRELLRHASLASSLVATVDSRLAGHLVCTGCDVADAKVGGVLLGPLAVAPTWQRQGIGSALVHTGLRRVREAGAGQVFVLGDPNYYGRFGFLPEHRVAPPYPLPSEWAGAWQSLRLAETAPLLEGTLSPPQPWLRPALWGP